MQIMGAKGEGGAETFFVNLALALEAESEPMGINQKLIIRPNEARERKLAAGGCEVITLPFGGPLDISTRFLLGRMIKKWQPDIALCWMSRATSKCPPPRGRGFVKCARLGGYYDLKYYADCDHLIANTEDIRRYLIDGGWPAARAHYIPNFCAVDKRPALDRAALDTPPDAPLLLALGRLHPSKAMDVAITALAELPGVYLWIAGEGDELANLRQLALRTQVADRVRFLGWRGDRGALLRAADIVVFPSRYEPFGNVVIDAWAHDVPIVAAASTGPKNLIRDGVDGLLAPVDDAAAMAAGVRRLLDNPEFAQACRTAGLARIAGEFARERVLSRYQEFFDHVRKAA